ncbi:hypothetical protein Q8A73_009676 [Channa argus]|nr:hypothetical protein Q8A73_009676 [Channa argus]
MTCNLRLCSPALGCQLKPLEQPPLHMGEAGSAVFEGPPVPLISRGTPRCEQAPSPGLPHCSGLFLYPRSLHSTPSLTDEEHWVQCIGYPAREPQKAPSVGPSCSAITVRSGGFPQPTKNRW